MNAKLNSTAAAPVYFTSLKIKEGETRASKLAKLCRKAGIESIDFDKKFTAIKMHFGEAGNLAFIRPDYARVIVSLVKELGGRPFLTDCNTLYPGRRKNALEHIELAYEHGFSPFSTDCHIIIGDGLTGSNETEIDVPNGVYVQKAKIGTAIMDADVLVSLTHFKGHVEAGFGGALKNVGMGSGSRAGKQAMHASTGPVINTAVCIGCKKCAKHCASDAISYPDGKAQIDKEKCVECGHCIAACPVDAISTTWDESTDLLNAKIAEYAAAVLADRPGFHIALAMDISPLCDCWGANDLPIVPDVGFFASFDPVALDQACVDAVNRQPVTKGSALETALEHSGHDHAEDNYFALINAHSNCEAALAHAEAIGLGTRSYELIEV